MCHSAQEILPAVSIVFDVHGFEQMKKFCGK